VGRWTARQVNRNGEQGEHYEHLQAKPLQSAIFPQPINQKKNDRHGKPNYREMIYHQVNVRPVRQSYQPFECCGVPFVSRIWWRRRPAGELMDHLKSVDVSKNRRQDAGATKLPANPM